MAARERQAVRQAPQARAPRPSVHPAAEAPVPLLRRPMAFTLSAIDEIAASLAREGVRIGGAFARRHTVMRQVEVKPSLPPEGEGDEFVGRFEIPTTDNDGNPFAVSLVAAVLHDLYDRMGGASFLELAGLWRGDDGTFYADLSIAVEVWTRDRSGLLEFIGRTCRLLDQKSIALRIYRPEFVWVDSTREGAS